VSDHASPRAAASRPESLRVVITVDPYIPVPPTTHGGIERAVALLAKGLVQRGHSVSLVAHPESCLAGATILGYGCPPHFTKEARAREVWQVWRVLHQLRHTVDIVHSFGRLAGLIPMLPQRGIAKLQSYQRPDVPWSSVRIAQAVGGSSLRFTGCSSSLYRGPARGGSAAGDWVTVYNGVDTSLYRATPVVSECAPLVFLGRLEPIKGVHHAIAIARKAGRRLLIAGNRVEEGGARGYFEKEIAPYLDDHWVRWVGPVDDAQKSELLGAAAALLMPIEVEEAFGIVMAESMACGTPVIAWRRRRLP
jgi:glycosyltransferase involved in cell wall biosynthesis